MSKQVSKISKRPSMKDVADLAGVSRTTVSFVLNGKAGTNIPAETQERVWQAVKKLSYRPNAIARNLRSQVSNTIGFISDEVSTTPFAGRILQGAQDLAWKHKKLLLSVSTGGDTEIRDVAVDMMLERQVDGIIYATMYHREVRPPAAIREAPTVLLDCFVEDASLPSIVPDELLGGYTATKYLIDRGHRRVGFLCEVAKTPARYGRLEGYRKALAEAGIEFDAELVMYSSCITHKSVPHALEMLKLENRPTGIFCYNDRMAMGVYEALRRMGLSVPDDVAIVGFDNHELIAADVFPGLTTMALPHYAMGQWAIQHLMKLITDERFRQQSEAQPVQKIIECPLVERESV